MKKYLNRRHFKINLLLTLFVSFLFLFPQVRAQSKLDYYIELFSEEFDFEIYDHKDEDEETALKFFNEDTKDKYLVILSSMIKKLESEESTTEQTGGNSETPAVSEYEEFYRGIKKNIIFICDDKYSSGAPLLINCDKSFVESQEGIKIGGIVKISNFNNIELYIIPEDFLVSPEKRSEIKDYIDAIKRSDKAPESSEDAQPEDDAPSTLDRIRDFKDTMVFEFFIISISMFVIASLSWGFLKLVTKEGRKFNLDTLKEISNSLKEIKIYQKVMIFIVLAMLLGFVSLAFLISIKDGQGVNIGYLLSYTLETFNISKLNEFSRTGSFFRIGLFAYGLVTLIFIFIFLIPLFVQVAERFREKIFSVNIKSSVIKYSLPLLIVFSLIGSSFFEVSASIKFLVFTLVLLTFLFFKASFDKNLDLKYSTKEKILFLSISFVIVVSGFSFRLYQKDSNSDYKTEDLIGVADEVVLLPYSKQLGDNTFMNEFLFVGEEPVFVDHYMVYSPIHSKISNKNAMDFKNEGSFYIQNGDLSDIVKVIHSNSELFNVLVSESPSNFFRINNPKIGETTDKGNQIEITFSCVRENLGHDKVKVGFYYVEEDGEVHSSDSTLMYFPGCVELGRREKYKLDLDLPYTESEYIYVRLVDVFGTDLADIKIYKDDAVITPTYISKNRGYAIIDSGELTTSAIVPVTNYIFGSSYDLSFDIELNEEGKFDMSKPINELIKEGVLENGFLIWSTKKYQPVRLPD